MPYNIVKTDVHLQELMVHGTTEFPISSYFDDLGSCCDLRINPHWHREVEFSVILEGVAEYVVERDTVILEKGSGIFINARAIHGYEPRGKTSVANIVFSPELIAGANQLVYHKYVEPILLSRITYKKFTKHTEWHKEIIQYLERIFMLLQTTENCKEIKVQAVATQLWQILYEHRKACTAPQYSTSALTVQARVKQMLNFIERHYTEKIQLADIAAAANVSKNEALRCFREGVGISTIDYLIHFRLNKAREMLMSPEKSITDIALAVGFEHLGYFDRMFRRKYNITPNNFRKRVDGTFLSTHLKSREIDSLL